MENTRYSKSRKHRSAEIVLTSLLEKAAGKVNDSILLARRIKLPDDLPCINTY